MSIFRFLWSALAAAYFRILQRSAEKDVEWLDADYRVMPRRLQVAKGHAASMLHETDARDALRRTQAVKIDAGPRLLYQRVGDRSELRLFGWTRLRYGDRVLWMPVTQAEQAKEMAAVILDRVAPKDAASIRRATGDAA